MRLFFRWENLNKKNGGVQCDLSAIAKGYAVDLVAEKLMSLGFENFMVEVGGEVTTRGRRLDGRIWRIGIEKPDAHGRAVQRAVPLDNMALATSGDYRNYREIDGKRFSHILDPRTGQPIENRVASVSVIHPSCMTADALATAFSVMGFEDSMAIAQRDKLAAIFLLRGDSDTFEEHRTPAAEKILELLKSPQSPQADP